MDPVKLAEELKGNHDNLIMTQCEMAMLCELVEILQPFAEATDLLQGDSYPTIGCVVPSIVGLHKCLNTLSSTVKYHTHWLMLCELPCVTDLVACYRM